MKSYQYEVGIVGAGIVGLAMALAAAKRGKKVAVFERNSKAQKASIRNFGMIWPIGQPAGNLFDRAMRSRETWIDIAKETNLSIRKSGSLHLAYTDIEFELLKEFYDTRHAEGYKIKLIAPADVRFYSPLVNPNNLKGALWSETELNVSPRQAIGDIAEYLIQKYKVDFYFNTTVIDVNAPYIYTFNGEFMVHEQIFICSGADFETLYHENYLASGITKCKLQMLATEPQAKGFDMGAMLCAGLTLRHYDAFKHCTHLSAVSDYYDSIEPRFKKWGIHVLLSQNSFGQLVIGDSHEYGINIDPFDKEEINKIILEYLETFAHIPNPNISERWHGVYPKLAGATEYIEQIEENLCIVNGLSGAGMTLSFGLAEEIMARIFPSKGILYKNKIHL